MKQSVAWLLVLVTLLTLGMVPTTAQSTVVDVCFRDMETTQSDLNTARCTFALSQATYTQGSHSVEYTMGADAAGGLLVWYFYTSGQNGSVNIAGATHLQFDLYVPTNGYFDKITGDARVQIDDADHKNAWGSSGGTASATSTKAALKGLKAGWNHVSIPLDAPSTCTNAVDLRIYMGNSGAKQGDKLYLDDLRFVNEAANATVVPLRNSAKKVISLITLGEYAQAAESYAHLPQDAKAYVPQSMVDTYGLQSTTTATLNVPLMSFNIRQSEGGDSGMNHWNNRKEAVYDYLNNSGAHVMCLQEVKSSQAKEITAALADNYTAVYYERDESANPEGLMNIYDNTLYQLVDQQIFWLSETPDVMSKGWGANYYRICVVTMLKHKQLGKLLNVFNVHLDHQVEAAQVGGMNLVLERLAKRVGHNVVMGDFNVTASNNAYKAIAAKMKDCQVTAPNADSGCTYHGWQNVTTGSPIDFIFVNQQDTLPQSFTIGRDHWGEGYFYSDHYAVRSTVAFTYYSDDQQAANKVISLIDNLNVTDKQAVAQARATYEALSNAQKALVTNLAKLIAAEENIAKLEEQEKQEAANKAAAKQVDDLIDALDVKTLDDEPAVVAAREAYEALTDAQKAYVTKLAQLEAAEQAIQDLKNVVPPVEITYGDVDGDGKVSAADALEVLKSVVGKVTLTDEQKTAADVDGSGKVDATDALDILKKVVGNIDKFPVEQ